MSASRTLNLARRSQTYLLLTGVVVGMFVAGIAVPLVFGESLTSGGDQGASSSLDLGNASWKSARAWAYTLW